ncbi:MAG: hypothetical protein A2Y67_01160 [Candidatus Buchananbacteria bacterium RBG_13_39_9]|uniref:UPF0235 protein A2Y67_01160 n=1 Tax=Candidatus Buchananbacteria bacterium RBG_13_39_9 TaxID=1797531 RepID=A0A1G1XLV5_9BACT|nr:MAG: hypothetical protein A2Y67_01160 [Candidatus Buchananbacteria bacterium RBG_13_39_9]
MAEKIFHIKVVPNAKINKIVEEKDNFFKIKLNAPAIENKANLALIEFLSRHFKIAKSRIELIKGQKSRNKIVKVNL